MSSPPLYEFKAGRTDFDSKTGLVTPVAGQGRITLMNSSEDPALLGLQWIPRGTSNKSNASEELLLVPGDVEFTFAPECHTGRVIQMRFESSGERQFFWLQTPPDGDLNWVSPADVELLEELNRLASTFGEEEDEEDVEMAESKNEDD